MTNQSEQTLEDNLIKQLENLGHEFVTIRDEKDLIANLKTQLEKHNKVKLSDNEFRQVLNHLGKGTVFEKAKTLRDRFMVLGEDMNPIYLEFIDQVHWCKNTFQVTRQVTMEGTYKNRYDVTMLINGIPMVHIELKRRGLELKEAFNQINRYQRHSFTSSYGLFQYVQIYVISNGVNTKFYANNKKQTFKQAFYWSDIENKRLTNLEDFAEAFLEKCHIAKMITKYIVLHESDKILMVLRPYQYYATEAIVEQVKNSQKYGYIWHTTGSGKTLTSFKASQILTEIPKVHKVVFVVDRKDLDYQTTKEYNSYSKGSVDGTDNTRKLVEQFSDDTKLIVTTIQKLNNAISNSRYRQKMEKKKDERIVFIFDECHRSQFGDTHAAIKNFFTKNQMFGFTGTPIFADNATSNALGKRTTKDLFGKCLHKYVITDAIRDENVLKFSVEYVGRYREKEGSKNEIDIEVEAIDTKELMESEKRLEKIADYIIHNHDRKTHNRKFTAMFCVSSVDVLTKYYDLFKKKKDQGEHNLKIATVFSYTANEEDKDADGLYDSDFPEGDNNKRPINKHNRDKLEGYIQDYNKIFGSNFSTKDSRSFYNYYNDIAKKVKAKEIDLLLVVNMFLTGFDSKSLNTLFVDKNLKYHGLIQAYSRTNRILDELKSQGNIVVFRNLKPATDQAIALFSNKEAKEEIFLEPYGDLIEKFNSALEEFYKLTPTVDSVNELATEDDEFEFVKKFRELIRIMNVLKIHSDFDFEDIEVSEQEFEDFKSKYLDIYDKVRSDRAKEKVSILNDVDFELELIHRDEINVKYIMELLTKLKNKKGKEYEDQRKAILDLISGEAQLRSKRELIEKFIQENLPHVDDEEVYDEFERFWTKEQEEAFEKMCEEENLNPDKFKEVLERYLFTERMPLRDDIVGMLEQKPKLLERKTIIERLTAKIKDYVETFVEGIGV